MLFVDIVNPPLYFIFQTDLVKGVLLAVFEKWKDEQKKS